MKKLIINEKEQISSNGRRKKPALKVEVPRYEPENLEYVRGDDHYDSDDEGVSSFLARELSASPEEQREKREQLKQGCEKLITTYLFNPLNSTQTPARRETMVVSPTDVMLPPTSPSNN